MNPMASLPLALYWPREGGCPQPPKPRRVETRALPMFPGEPGAVSVAGSPRYRISTPTLKKRLAEFVGVVHPPSVSDSRP